MFTHPIKKRGMYWKWVSKWWCTQTCWCSCEIIVSGNRQRRHDAFPLLFENTHTITHPQCFLFYFPWQQSNEVKPHIRFQSCSRETGHKPVVLVSWTTLSFIRPLSAKTMLYETGSKNSWAIRKKKKENKRSQKPKKQVLSCQTRRQCPRPCTAPIF